jgi:hypothetical protein
MGRLVFALAIFAYALTMQGTKAGPEGRPVEGIEYVDGVKFSSLSAAISACPSAGCIIFDVVPETFTTDPFAGSAGKGIDVYFGAGVWTANVTISPKSVQRLVGTGRVYGASGGTILRAGRSMPAYTPVVKLDGTQGVRAENLTIDCHSVAGSTGIYATDINEQGGAVNDVIVNCAAFGVNVDASAFSVIPAQNYVMRDLEIFPQCAGSASTIGLRMRGNGGGGPGEVRNITSNGQAGKVIRASVQIENFSQAVLTNVHGEHSAKVLDFNGTSACPSDVTVINVSGGPAVAGGQTVVDLSAASCESNGLYFTNIVKNQATYSLNDAPRGFALSDADITAYVVGPGELGRQEIYSTSPSVPKFINSQFQLRNTPFASLGTPPNGTFTYCNNCKAANPCAGGGTGAFAKRLNGGWVCN